jgi:AcrR family transcriptional regulator
MLSSTVSSGPGARRSAHDRRECIIAAARTLFASHGFHATGMAEIARVSQVRVGQIYRDFAGKEALIAAIVERDVSEWLDDPEISGAMEDGNIDRMNSWVRRFICRKLDDETRNVLADIMAEATRNPSIAAIVTATHQRLRERLISAATLWSHEPDQDAARRDLADLILTAAGAIHHRQILGLDPDARMTMKMVELVEHEVRQLERT